MQNVQNAEIKQRVINLVELYRTKVGKDSQTAKDLAEKYKRQYDDELDIAMYLHEQGTNHYTLNIDIPEEDIDLLRANEQLLCHFYKETAGKNADPKVLHELLDGKYYNSVFSAEEENFLLENFKEMVNYIIQTPNNDLSAIEGSDRMDFYLIPTEVLELIKNRVDIPAGSKIYNPFTGFAQLACLYPNCSFLCEESYIPYNKKWNSYCDWSRKEANVIHHKIDDYKLYAWMKVALHANGVDVSEKDINITNGSYDTVMAFVPWVPNAIPENAYGYSGEAKNDQEIVDKIYNAYHYLPDGGKMILLLPNECLYGNLSIKSLWDSILKDNSLVEVIQLPSIMGKHLHRDFCIVIAEKNRKDNNVTFTDARFAYIKSNDNIFMGVLDVKAFKNMIRNNGIEENMGLRKSVQIPSSLINPNLLIPQIYVVEKPSEEDNPVPLSDLCQLVTKKVRDVKYDLPLDTPVVHATNLSLTYCGALDVKTLAKANCPNNPPHTEEYTFDKEGHFIDDPFHYIFGEGSVEDKSLQIAEYRHCVFLDGSNHAVLVVLTKEGLKTALFEPSGTPIAVETNPSMSNKHFYVFCPKEGVDVQYLLAVLRLPIVCRQLQAFDEFGLYGCNGLFKDIIVPTNKLILYDEIQRLHREQDVYKTQEEELTTKKKEYINEVRMRKHDMGQYIFELMNIEDLMRYYLDNKKDDKNFFQQIRTLLDNFRDSLRELSTMLDNLSKEEQFGEPEPIDIHDFLLKLENRHQADGYKILTILDLRALRDYREKIAKTMGISVSLEDIDSTVPMIYISRNDLQRMVNNILDNAHKHGFTDSNRKDYEIQVWVSIDANKRMFQFDFRNNGNPLPEGMNKMRYGIKGEKAGKTGGTGMGGNYVKAFVEHYGGDYDIFMEDGWTVVRILLPIK